MKIAFLGDSITLGYALERRETDRFPAVFCRMTGHEEINLGITGTLVARAGLSASDGTAYVDRFPQTAGADYAVVFGGTNDYFWSDTPISGGDGDVYFGNAVHTLCRGLLAMFPKEKILFLTPYPHHGIGNFAGGTYWRESSEHDTDCVNFVGHTLTDYADVLCNICEEYGIRVLDLRKCEEPFDWRSMTSDGCHPNPSGHRWLAERIMEVLR
ncbi:MAG: SGNH/GDSL hydrolase family protein [Clostridia bacterium]|nr:SGNH/GDSL hydrolase family protein [Clostridia bacterium]